MSRFSLPETLPLLQQDSFGQWQFNPPGFVLKQSYLKLSMLNHNNLSPLCSHLCFSQWCIFLIHLIQFWRQSSHFHVNAAGYAFSFFFFLDVLYWNKRPFGLIQTQLWQSAQCSLTADLHHPDVLVPVIFSSHWSGSSSGGCVTMTVVTLLIKVSPLPSQAGSAPSILHCPNAEMRHKECQQWVQR